VILHLDMDSFFASVEVLDDPGLAGRPLVVGGSVERGVVASASYEARRFGIRSAMPTAEARRRCPDLLVVPPRHGRYAEVSHRLLDLLQRVTPSVEPVALDEAYLDVTGILTRGGDPGVLAARLRSEVRDELGLTCSVGAGRTKLVAKLASKAAKPRPAPAGDRSAEARAPAPCPPPASGPGSGVVVVGPDEEGAFLRAHPARALPGVGPRTADKLRRYGVDTVGDLLLVDLGSLVRLLGRAQGTLVHDLAHGRDPRPLEPDRATGSIGHEETFAADERSAKRLESLALEMAQAVASRCRANEVVPRRVTVKVRFADFTTITRSRTLPGPVTTGAELGRVAAALLAEVPPGSGVRLLGVHASSLVRRGAAVAAPEQLSLFAGPPSGSGGADGGHVASSRLPRGPGPAEGDAPPLGAAVAHRHEGVEAAADAIRRRYGERAIASLAAAARRQAER
jgi:DNA polymerase-4